MARSQDWAGLTPSVVVRRIRAPFVLNFMDEGYKLKPEFDGALENPQRRTALASALSAGPTAVLVWDEIDQYAELDPGNGRIRALLEDTVARGAHRMLWVPPALPYYQPAGAFAAPGVAGFTKRLVFSSWRLVPRAIAACLSYEAERRMVGRSGAGANTPAARQRRAPLLRFARADGRLTGMPVLALMYPSAYLARACDPAHLARTSADGSDVSLVDAPRVLREAESIIEVALQRLRIAPILDGPEDERWYWAAPLLLDQALEPAATKAWFAQPGLAALWAGQRKAAEPAPAADEDADTAGWGEHVQAACELATGSGARLGRAPTDLVQILARIAIAAPGVAMLRALLLLLGMRPEPGRGSRRRARARDRQAPLRGHVPPHREPRRLRPRPRRPRKHQAPGGATHALPLCPPLRGRENRGRKSRHTRGLRAQGVQLPVLALRRRNHLRRPGRPRLSHLLPRRRALEPALQPLDLEQREGRVHRFKGHAVRKNVALAHGKRSLEDDAIDPGKPCSTRPAEPAPTEQRTSSPSGCTPSRAAHASSATCPRSRSAVSTRSCERSRDRS